MSSTDALRFAAATVLLVWALVGIAFLTILLRRGSAPAIDEKELENFERDYAETEAKIAAGSRKTSGRIQLPATPKGGGL